MWQVVQPLYQKWSNTPPQQRSSIVCPGQVAPRHQWIDNYWRSRLRECLPKRVQQQVRQQEEFGTTCSCAQLLYMLLKEQGPGDLKDIDEVTKHLRSPTPCTDAAAAQIELRRWWSSLQRATQLGIAWPDIRELYRASLSIYSNVLSEHHDPQVQHRWHDTVMRSGGSHVQTWAALETIQEHARSELEMLVTTGQKGSSTALPLTDAQKQQQERHKHKAAVAAVAAAAPPTRQ